MGRGECGEGPTPAFPFDQPWVLMGQTLMAIGERGDLTQLDVPVIDVVTALDRSPLIVTHSNSNQYMLRDSETWTDRLLTIPTGLTLQGGSLLSPTGTQFASVAWSQDGQAQVLVTDIAAAVSRILIPDIGADPITPLAWNDQLLLTHLQRSGSSYF